MKSSSVSVVVSRDPAFQSNASAATERWDFAVAWAGMGRRRLWVDGRKKHKDLMPMKNEYWVGAHQTRFGQTDKLKGD